MAAYAGTVNALRASYLGGKLATVEARRHQLKRFIAMLEENKDLWRAALHKDLHKASFEADLCEIMFTLNEAKHAHNELDNWVKPEKVRIVVSLERDFFFASYFEIVM